MRLLNAERDENGINWAKNSMILCWLDVDASDQWRVEQLGKDLQEIIVEFADDLKNGYDEEVQSTTL